jgi:nucleoside-diphosphate-sugar epimerase
MRYFVTGASGWIGSAVVPELLEAGHEVVGLARSEASAAALRSAGVQVATGSLDELEVLRSAASEADGVLHLAFKHDIAFSGDYEGAARADRAAIEVFGSALAGSDRPLVIASGTLGLAPGRLATELDGTTAVAPSDGAAAPSPRLANAQFVTSLAASGVRSSVVRLPPTCHGDGDNGFMAMLVGIARDKGVAGYLGDGTTRWPATHRRDAAHLFCLAAQDAPAGSTLHAVAEEGVQLRDVAEVIGRHLEVPVASISTEDAWEHFGFLSLLLGLDSPASSTLTRELMGWQPIHPGLLADFEEGHYFRTVATAPEAPAT